ncbi:MAG: tetratricopeptide repeat protein [Kofleriaceae bacterium]
MGSPRWAHLVIVAGLASASVQAQPRPDVELGPPDAKDAIAARPAGSSSVESSDVPVWVASPPRVVVTRFENRSKVRAFDWLIAAAPFEIAEKTQGVLGLPSAAGPLHVTADTVPTMPADVAALAAKYGAEWVVTGWVERPNWELRIDVTVWRVVRGVATLATQAQRTGPVANYHKLVGELLTQLWRATGMKIDEARAAALERPLATDLYAVHLMGRGLGHLTSANALAPDPNNPAIAATRANELKLAQHDLERSVFIDPKNFAAQRLVGELYLVLAAGGEPKLAAKAGGKFAYASDLAPDDIESTRAAGLAAARSSKQEVARDLFRKLVTQIPWDLEARYQLGAALWQVGDAAAAERQLTQVTVHKPDHLAARRVLVLIHSARSDTKKLVTELEAIAARAPMDLEVKADLATGYAALGQWDRSTHALEAIALTRAPDLALLVRIGDGHVKLGDLDGALAWYARAAKQSPEASLPGFASAQALYDAGKLTEANRAYTSLQRFRDQLPAAEHALGVIALRQSRPDDAAWYLRRAVREEPGTVAMWQALLAAEIARKDPAAALVFSERALVRWPTNPELRYLTGIAHALLGNRSDARTHLIAALEGAGYAPARAALGALDAGGSATLAFTPNLVRPWGNAEAISATLVRYTETETAMARSRAAYQRDVLAVLGALGRGPNAPSKSPPVKVCPIGRITRPWSAAAQELRRYEQLGVELEASFRYLARHDEVGATAALLPNARTQLASAKRAFRTALADVTELRTEWTRTLAPELRVAGCSDKLLAAAVADPERYRVGQDDRIEPRPPAEPTKPSARSRTRATFYVDNTRCPDPVEVWIDGAQIGEVAPGRRSALVADGGERTLCLLGPGAAQCGDRGTVRQVYLHDGWSVALHCPK